jgi:chromosome segregation ATPase
MFRFLELELHGWDFWSSLRVPLDAGVVVLSGPNGSGKTTMLDAVRQVLHAPRLSQNRRVSHYLRQPNRPALLRAVVSNPADERGRRPFDRQQVFTDEATLACALVPDGGSPEKRYAVLPGRVAPQELQSRLLEGRDWLAPEEYRRVLDYAGVSRSLMHILALEQGRADELSRQKPRELFRWVMEARGTQQVLERYTGARRRYEDSVREVQHQRAQVARYQTEQADLERQVRRLDEHAEKRGRVEHAGRLSLAARLQARLLVLGEAERKLPELRTKIANLATTVERLHREVETDAAALAGLREAARAHAERAQAATAECDAAGQRQGRFEAEVARLHGLVAELATIAEEDGAPLEHALEAARSQLFAAGHRGETLAGQIDDLTSRLADLERGVPRFPQEVEHTLAALATAGLHGTLAAPSVEVADDAWAVAIESALGPTRYALCIHAEDEPRVTQIARENGFPGPIVADLAEDAASAGPLRLGRTVPRWLETWGRTVQLAGEPHPPEGEVVLLRDGTRRDARGVWVSRAPDRVLGGSAVRAQLEAARTERDRLVDERRQAQQGWAEAKERATKLESRLEVQHRRAELAREASALPEREADLARVSAEVAERRHVRDAAQEERREAERAVTVAELALGGKRDEASAREKELQGTREAVSEMEQRRAALEPEVETLSAQIDPDLLTRARAGELPSEELAKRDLEQARETLLRLEAEGPIPDATVREELRVLSRNLEELHGHVRARQAEADAAGQELNECRQDYLGVVQSTLHDYARRARGLAELASARVEIELPRLENNDRSIDEAGIVVRIGFDGKRPTDLGDTAHSGGQQVVSGLVLLMAMAETEGDTFFIVDEPFAHLSLDRVDDVGKFLRRSGAQFLITVPTTLDRGQLDPASLLIVLKKKAAGEEFAPRPIVARA